MGSGFRGVAAEVRTWIQDADAVAAAVCPERVESSGVPVGIAIVVADGGGVEAEVGTEIEGISVEVDGSGISSGSELRCLSVVVSQ